MDLTVLREWLIQKGVPAEYLDQIEEPPVIHDIGEGLLLSMQNADDLGHTLVMVLQQMEEQTAELVALRQRVAALEGGEG